LLSRKNKRSGKLLFEQGMENCICAIYTVNHPFENSNYVFALEKKLQVGSLTRQSTEAEPKLLVAL
jgi:hypothetical protein